MDRRVLIVFGVSVVLGASLVSFFLAPPSMGMDVYGSQEAIRCYTACDGEVFRGDNLSCWNRDARCSRTVLRERYSRCNDWYVGDPVERLVCNYTEHGVEEVAYIPDPGNHITTPFGANNPRSEVLTPGFRSPQDIEFFPDGRALVISTLDSIAVLNRGMEISSEVSVSRAVDPEAMMLNGFLEKVIAVAIDPDFGSNRHIYVYYAVGNDSDGRFETQTDPSKWRLRLSRFRFEGGLRNETVLLDIRGPVWHSGGGLESGPDGNLYLTLGEGHRPRWSQDMDTYRGKILRLNRNGTVPADNPFDGSYIYTYGHRNPQGIAWNPATGTAFAAEHGNWRRDEINRLVPGGNYGWGRFACGTFSNDIALRSNDTVLPVRCYRNWTLAPSRMTFVDTPGHPWYGDLFVAGLRGKHVRRYHMGGDTITGETIFYVNRPGPRRNGVSRRFRDIEYFNGSLWVLGDTRGIVRLTPGG